jgi:hypothetical protein
MSYLHDPPIDGETQIWYAKPESVPNTIFGPQWLRASGIEITAKTLQNTHVLLGSVSDTSLESIFHRMQAEIWSPEGEARSLIQKKGLAHTSMSVGDVIVSNGKAHMVDQVGFVELAGSLSRRRVSSP